MAQERRSRPCSTSATCVFCSYSSCRADRGGSPARLGAVQAKEIWPRVPALSKLGAAWAEDRALLGSNPSADPGAEMGEGGMGFCPRRLLDESRVVPSGRK